jgi:hypothetical protein
MIVTPLRRALRAPSLPVCSLSAALLLGACSSARPPAFQREEFEVNNTTYSRSFDANESQTCEAARRALLSQGYVVTVANADLVNARKSFQPENETHVEIEFRIVCTAKRKGLRPTLAFVSALQDRYALKKSANSASVGVGAIGSLSLPFTSGDDSMVKVASETITTASFYDRFFKLLTSYLVVDPDPAAPPPAPLDLPNTPPSPSPSPSPAGAASAPAAAASQPR